MLQLHLEKVLVGFLLFVLASFLVASVSCRWGEYHRMSDTTLGNVSRIFIHKPNQYSLIYEESSGISRLKEIDWIDPNSIKIVSDVAENEKMWVTLKTEEAIYSEFGKQVKRHTRFLEMELHVHSIKNIEGGEWRERRSSGTTLAIE